MYGIRLCEQKSPTSKIKSKLAKDIWKADNERLNELASHDYTVLVIWESEVKKTLEETINKCVTFLKQ